MTCVVACLQSTSQDGICMVCHATPELPCLLMHCILVATCRHQNGNLPKWRAKRASKQGGSTCLWLLPWPIAFTAVPAAPPYASSPSRGCPVCFACTRIWCVRPVCSRHCSRDAVPPANGSSSCHVLTACLPLHTVPRALTSMVEMSFICTSALCERPSPLDATAAGTASP